MKLGPNKLTELSAHINYDFAQIEYIANELPKRENDDQRLRWACLEAFLLYTRSLLDFLFVKKQGCCAGSYVVNADEWEAQVDRLYTPILRDAYTYASQRVAHLTPERRFQKSIEYTEIARDVDTAFYEFLKKAKMDLLCDELRKRRGAPEQRPILKVFATIGAKSISTSANIDVSTVRVTSRRD